MKRGTVFLAVRQHLVRACRIFFLWTLASVAMAQTPIFEIEIREHLFFPAELEIPANQ